MLSPMIGERQGDERTAASFDLIAWSRAALFPPHADPSPDAVLLAVKVQPDRSPTVRRIVDLSALSPQFGGPFRALAERGSAPDDKPNRIPSPLGRLFARSGLDYAAGGEAPT